ncbi:MAG: class I SAM-dependent methyltransferase [Halobacterium sp.]
MADDEPGNSDADAGERASGLRERIADQFSYRGERADVWRVFDSLLETDAYLNLGYSGRYQSHLVGSSQRRLADVVGRRLAANVREPPGTRVLDVGCGRGGPAVRLADEFGVRATGVDLVPYNVARARENAAERGVDAEFVVGDATRLPFGRDSLPAAVSVDALVYLPDRAAVLAELADVLEPGGVLVFTDLVADRDATDADVRAVDRFAAAWDMPELGSRPGYERALADAGFDVLAVEDLTPHSVGRFRKWTTLFAAVHATPGGGLLDRALERRGLDAATITEQIERAHEALPALEHVLVVAEA